jgi:hypothetical protein
MQSYSFKHAHKIYKAIPQRNPASNNLPYLDSTMVSSPVRIAPAFKKPKDLQGSFHVNEDDLGIFDLLEEDEQQNILDITLLFPKRIESLPMRSRDVPKTDSFSSVPSRKPQRRGSTSTYSSSTASVTSTSSSSGHSRSSRRSKSRNSSKSKSAVLLEQQMKDLSL